MAEETKTSNPKKTHDYAFLSEITEGNEMDIREYTQKVKDELNSLEEYWITDYLAVNKDVAILYQELGKSNDILDRVENIVTKFQTKLGNIADDVSKLQTKSKNYSISLTNRRELEKELHVFLDGILLSPDLVRDLIQSDIDIKYIDKLEEFNKILHNVDEVSKNSPDSKAIVDVLGEIEKLTIQVCHKIKRFLLTKFISLHKEKTNFQIVQKSVYLNFTKLNIFLREHSQEQYVEVTNQYSEYMSKRYYTEMRDYSNNIAKLVQEKITKNDMVIIDEYKYKNMKSDNDTFELEDRESILGDIEIEPIVPHHLMSTSKRISFEEAFRSQNKMLTNLVSTEYAFILKFFDLKVSQCNYIFNTLFSKIVNYFLDWLTSTAEYSYDIVSILMIILIKEKLKTELKERKIYILDYYFDKIEMALWPRFTTVFEHFLNNIKNAKPKNFKLYNFTVHFTTKRYVSLVLMLYKIASKTGHNMLLSRLSQLQAFMVEFIEKLAEESFISQSDKKNKLFFLVNNLHYIYSSINDLHLDIELKDLEKLEQKYYSEVSGFVKSTLKDQYSNMIDVVAEFGPGGDSDSSGSEEETKEDYQDKTHLLKGIEKKKLEIVAQEFSMVFRDKADSVIKIVKDNAYSDMIAKQILSKYMRILIYKYSTFLEIVKLSHPQFFKESLSSHHILLELKNISLEVNMN